MTQARRKKRHRRPAPVVALPGAERPEDAIKFIIEAAASGKLRGVIVHLVYEGAKATEMLVTGSVKRIDLAWAGTELIYEAHDP